MRKVVVTSVVVVIFIVALSMTTMFTESGKVPEVITKQVYMGNKSDEECCKLAAKKAEIIMKMRQNGVSKSKLLDFVNDEMKWEPEKKFLVGMINSAYKKPLVETSEERRKVITDYKYYYYDLFRDTIEIRQDMNQLQE